MRLTPLLLVAWLFGCDRAPVDPRAPPAARAAERAPAASAPKDAGVLPLSGSAASAVATGSASTAVAIEAPPRKPGELPGRTVDYPYDGSDVNDRSRAYQGRAFVHDAAAASTGALPLVVFLHGLNRELIPHRWMGGGNEGDVRRIVADLVDRGALRPSIVAGPGSVVPAAVSYGASFPVFDLDRFVELTEAALLGVARVDRARIVVTGHSGAGCSERGGLIAAVRAKTRPLAVISIDTCMAAPLAAALGAAPAETHVVVTWQTASWKRNFKQFQTVFARETAAKPGAAGVLRELDKLPSLPRAHDATVQQTYEKWLPRILGAR